MKLLISILHPVQTAKKYLLLLMLMTLCTIAFAQDYNGISRRIDSLNRLGLPKLALVQVDTLEMLARKKHSAPQQVKAAVYRITFLSYIEENALLTIITRLKADIAQAEYPVKPVLQSVLAGIYWQYYQQNRWQLGQRSHLEKPGDDITKWDLAALISQTEREYELSLQEYKKEQETPIGVLDGALNGNRINRYLRPTLYDLLVNRALDFLLAEEPALTRPKMPFTLNDPRFFSDSKTFANLNITTTDTASTFYRGIKYLQQATLFHLQKQDEEPLVDLDLRRLEFVYAHGAAENQDKLYLDALNRVATLHAPLIIAANALDLLGKYYYGKDSLKQAYYYFTRVRTNYPSGDAVNAAPGQLRMIEQRKLTAAVEAVNSPAKPLLALMVYRNVQTARLTVYKVSATQYNQLQKIPGDVNRYTDGTTIYASDSVFKYLSRFKPVQNELLQLPDPKDYREHSTEFKIDPMAPGHYLAIVRDDISNDKNAVGLMNFKVCGLTFVSRTNADGRTEVRVVNRETGEPVEDVDVTVAETNHNITDKNGVCYFNIGSINNYSVKVTRGEDTLYKGSNYNQLIYATNVPKKVERTLFFTDRDIYRPGQTVFYKGLHLQTVEGKSSILTGVSLTVDVKNNGKQMMTMPATTNEFGTFSGSFTIPLNILNGSVVISTSAGSKYISVEEYKRPSFEVAFSPIKGSYQPGDSVKLSGDVKAFSGYGLSNARVVYHVTRTGTLKDWRDFARYTSYMQNTVVVNDTVKTDNHGQFKINFKAAGVPGADMNMINYVYMVTADVLDGSGETRSATARVTVGINNFVLAATVTRYARATDTVKLYARVSNLNQELQKAKLHITIYELVQPAQLFKDRLWQLNYLLNQKPDQYLLGRQEFKKYFPAYAYGNEDEKSTWAVKKQAASLDTACNDIKQLAIKLNAFQGLPTGTYKVVVSARNAKGDTSSATTYASILNEPAKPESLSAWLWPLTPKVQNGKSVEFLVGTGTPCRVLMEKYVGSTIVSSQWLSIPGGKQQLVKVPVDTLDQNEGVQFMMSYQNRMYTSYVPIIIKKADQNLDIRFLTYRDKLQPGQKEQWKLQVSSKNKEQQAAEMIADLYDESLDKIARQDDWNGYQYNFNRTVTPYFNWMADRVGQNVTNPLKMEYYGAPSTIRYYENINMLGYSYYGGYNYGYLRMAGAKTYIRGGAVLKEDTTEYKAAPYGVFKSAGSLNEVVINQLPGINVDKSGNVTAQATAVTNVRINGKDYFGGDIQAQTRNLPADVIENIQMIDDYGYQSTLGGAQMMRVVRLDPIATRKNFAETAFFYPQLHTDEKGQILIDFTIPESLTRWKFKAFAHTKDLQTGYIESEVVTQKQLSITANMPRFLREGDTLMVSARLANLTTVAMQGKVNLQLFNAVNMQPVQLLVNPADAEQSFDLAAATIKGVSFKVIVPQGLYALNYHLTADAGQFTDGEENTLPVLPNRMLVTESMPMMMRSGQTKSFTFDKLLNQHSTTLQSKTLTLEYTQNPAWYAVQALPYMMEFPYECSEQVFSRYYANSMATNLVNKMPVIKQVFDRWKAVNSAELTSNLEKNPELKATLLEETPWVRDAQNESEQKKRIALLFDLNKMSYELTQNLQKLQDRQLPGGGFPWFGGDRPDAYITRLILAGMGQLYHLGIADEHDAMLKQVAGNALGYMDHEIIAEAEWEKRHSKYDNRGMDATEVHSWYTRSYFTKQPLNAALQPLLANYLNLAAAAWKATGIYEQCLIALTMLRYNKPEVARSIIRSLTETAQQTNDMGMYWAKNSLGYYWYQSPIETQSLMIELFTEAGGNDKAVEEMKIWLLREKQTTNWKTTKATAAACYALLLKGSDWLADTAKSVIRLNGIPLSELKPDIRADAGTGYIKTAWADSQVKPELGKVSISNNGKTISWGALHWQYLEQLDKITPSATDIHLERKYFIQKQTDNGTILTAVDATHRPKTGDLLKVVVYLKAGRDFEYIQLKDMRPAGTEPVDVLSKYKYQDGLYYYQVTKDVATNFFISNLNKGSYVFEYRLRVAQPGNFSTGISTVQCMYAPEFNAHSQGERLVVGQ